MKRRSFARSEGNRDRLALEQLESRRVLTFESEFIDIMPGEHAGYSSLPSRLTAVSGDVFFIANGGGEEGFALWKSDGSDAGTHLVKDVLPTHQQPMFNMNGTLWFAEDSSFNLWRSDGSESGTYRLGNLRAAGHPGVNVFAAIGSDLVFYGSNESIGGLWKTDGTELGTVFLKSLYIGGPFVEMNGELYFRGGETRFGSELWKTNGTAEGTVQVADIAPGPDGGPISRYLTNVNGTIFFGAGSSLGGQVELWRSDGTAAGTQLVLDVDDSNSGVFSEPIANVNGKLVFVSNDGTHGTELWISDGTAGNTHILKDIKPGIEGSSIQILPTSVMGDYIYFTADDGVHGHELWRSDGTPEGTALFKDFNTAGESHVSLGVVSQGFLFFSATDGAGEGMWVTDGSGPGTQRVLGENIQPMHFVVSGDKVFARAGAWGRGIELVVVHVGMPPIISGVETALTYTEGEAAVPVAPSGVVGDVDSPDFGGGKLDFTILQNGAEIDDLSLVAGNGVTVADGDVFYNDVFIGNITGGSEGEPLTIEFNASVTPAVAQVVLRQVHYRAVGANPWPHPRSLGIRLFDGDGGVDSQVIQTISIDFQNDAPTGTNLSSSSVLENLPASTLVGIFSTQDPDQEAAFTYVLPLDNTTDNAAFSVQGSKLYTAASFDFETKGSYFIRVITRDAAGAELPINFTIQVGNVSEGAQLAVSGDARQGATLSATLSDSDGYSNASLTWSWERSSNGNTWSAISGANASNYVLTQVDVRRLIRARVSYTDAGGFSESLVSTATALVQNINDAPAGTNKTITMIEDGMEWLPPSAFGFTDPIDSPDDALIGVKITTLPAVGTLSLNNVPVAAGSIISTADLTAGLLRFRPSPHGNGLNYASFTFQVKDSGGTSFGGVDLDPTPNKFTFNVTSENDSPQISGFGDAVTYVENAANPVAIASSAVRITDVDSTVLTGGTLTVTYLANGTADDRLAIRSTTALKTDANGKVFYNNVEVGSYAGGEGTIPLVVTFNNTMNFGIASVILRNVVYSSVSNAPKSVRTVWVQAADGDPDENLGAEVSKAISVTPMKDKPAVLSFGSLLTYKEGDPHLLIALSTTSIVEPDLENFGGGSLTVKVSNGVKPEDTFGIRSGGAITTDAQNQVLYNNLPIGTYSGGAGTPLVVSFNADASAFRASLLLKRIYYRNTSQKPLEHDRTVWVQVNDGKGMVSTPVTKTLSVQAVNDPPTLTGFSSSPIGYTRNDPAVVALAPSALVRDVDNTNFNGGRLILEVTSGVDAGNLLSIAGPYFKVDAQNNLIKGTTIIGTVELHTANKLEISFNDQALLVRVQDLIRAIRFRTSGSTMDADRTISFTINDNATGEPATKAVTVDVR